jgi:energy-coupling factor transporter transmembrane protein EcfT
MFAFIFILILSVITLLAYVFLKKIKLLNHTVRIVLPVLFILILFLFFWQMCDTDSKTLGSDFIYSAEHKHITGKIDIPPTIISYNYDRNFIIAKQKPKKYHCCPLKIKNLHIFHLSI